MAYKGLEHFITALERENQLIRIKVPVNPVLEITEITDRVTKAAGKALLFENTGTEFPLLINIFGSDKRIRLALGNDKAFETDKEIEKMFLSLTGNTGTLTGKLSAIPDILRLSSLLPRKSSGRGECQEIIKYDPDLQDLPVLKCWPYDGGPFITLPVVHTIHPESRNTNAGMYRMQVLGRKETALHWQRHKTGANHFEAWKETGGKMPVSVSLGGDPVYTYAATAPLPENIDEYILAGFLRNKRVKLVKCITNDLYVPADADIILEGFVDPAEDPVWEGPFGDHTGFYSLPDWYPKFHITCITHRRNAVYPATIVGVPPQEDALIARVTERIFLTPVKLAMLPEIIDFHMPDAGTAHNLVIVKIRKNYPGQGMKVLSSLFGAGQMMFSKYIIAVSGDIDIRNYRDLAAHVLQNLDPSSDILFSRGPLDVLDHASDRFSFGGKAGIDATIKMPEELPADPNTNERSEIKLTDFPGFNLHVMPDSNEIPIILVSYDPSLNQDVVPGIRSIINTIDPGGKIKLVLAVNHHTDLKNYNDVAWQVLANSDPVRDHVLISSACLFIDGTTKAFRRGGFPRQWPNIVCSDEATIKKVDSRWDEYGIPGRIPSPSLRYRKMLWKGEDRII